LRARAVAVGRYPNSSITSWIRLRVLLATGRLPLSAYDTVLRDTPARRAISPMLMQLPENLPAGRRIPRAHRLAIRHWVSARGGTAFGVRLTTVARRPGARAMAAFR
jgi:hypothetical protein